MSGSSPRLTKEWTTLSDWAPTASGRLVVDLADLRTGLTQGGVGVSDLYILFGQVAGRYGEVVA